MSFEHLGYFYMTATLILETTQLTQPNRLIKPYRWDLAVRSLLLTRGTTNFQICL